MHVERREFEPADHSKENMKKLRKLTKKLKLEPIGIELKFIIDKLKKEQKP